MLEWFRSYLIERTQAIRVKGKTSQPVNLDCGVPQGSVLGPILFTIYTSSLGTLLRHNLIPYHMYADDTVLYLSCKLRQMGTAIGQMESCITSVQSWMAKHYLKMNNDKTEFLVISTKQMAQKMEGLLSLQIGSDMISPTPNAKNLGVMIDCNLSMEAQISSVCKYSYLQLRNINQISRYLDKDSLECIVHAFVTTRLDYCNSLLCGLPSTQIERLQSIQNAAARLLTGTRKYNHITPVLRALHWLPVQQRIKFKILVLVCRALHKTAPCYLQDLLCPYAPSRHLRSSGQNLLKVPFTNSSVVKMRCFSVTGPTFWNNLPIEIRSASSVHIFKSKLKTFLFNEYFN